MTLAESFPRAVLCLMALCGLTLGSRQPAVTPAPDISLMRVSCSGDRRRNQEYAAHNAQDTRQKDRTRPDCTEELFGRRYRLDEPRGLAAYIKALDSAIARSKREEPLGKAHEQEPLHHPEPRNFISKDLRHAMEETRDAAHELASAEGERREVLLSEVVTMAGAIRGAFVRVLPGNLDVLQALFTQGTLKHSPVGLGDRGIAANISRSVEEGAAADPILPSGRWNRPAGIANLDLYYGFGRTSLPDFHHVTCTYRRSKQSLGVHPGFDVQCREYGSVKLKFGECYSQPFAHRIFWALGYNTIQDDCVPIVKVNWDPRVFAEFNTHKNETEVVTLLGFIKVYSHHLQRYTDPLQCVSEIIMRNDKGKDVTVRPDPDWSDFKKKLYKRPQGRPETIPGNLNEDFAARIETLVYRNVNVQLKDNDQDDGGEMFLGNWDWNGEGNPQMRENRGFAFLSAWINQYDSWVHNNKLFLIDQGDKAANTPDGRTNSRRTFKYYITDLGGCLGPAADATSMAPERPNQFPWAFTRPARPGSSAIPLDGSFHNIRVNETFRAADIYDARWIARYMSQLTEKQILQALMSGGMPSAHVRVFFNKLVHRRNKALADIGLNYPPLRPMDESEAFDYDPRTAGPMTIITNRNETVTAPDDDWIVVKGRIIQRARKSKLKAVRGQGTHAQRISRQDNPRRSGASDAARGAFPL